MGRPSFEKSKLITLIFVEFELGYHTGFILPIVVFMCRDFGIRNNLIGLYSSLLISIFLIFQLFSSLFWGYISDKILGRRIPILFGLIMSCITIFLFGLSTSYVYALILRGTAGVFNANFGLHNAWICDITNDSNRAYVFSIGTVGYTLGTVVSSLLSGLLVITSNNSKSESILNNIPFFNKYTYLLPCIIGSFISLIALLLSYLYIDSDKEKITINKRYISESYKSLPLIKNDKTGQIFDSHPSFVSMNSIHPLYTGLQSINFNNINPGILKRHTGKRDIFGIRNIYDIFKKTGFLHVLIVYFCLVYFLSGWKVLNPLYLAQGLGFNALKIGIVNAWSGLLMNQYIFNIQWRILNYYEYHKIYIIFTIGLTILTIIWINMSYLDDIINDTLFLIIMCFVNSWKYIFAPTLFVIASCYLTNSVPEMFVGRANGIANALISFDRCISPIIQGGLWTYISNENNSNNLYYYIPYGVLIIFLIYSGIHVKLFIPHNLQYSWEKRMNNRIDSELTSNEFDYDSNDDIKKDQQ